MWHSWIVLLNRDNAYVQKHRLSNTNFGDIDITDIIGTDTDTDINIGATLITIT